MKLKQSDPRASEKCSRKWPFNNTLPGSIPVITAEGWVAWLFCTAVLHPPTFWVTQLPSYQPPHPPQTLPLTLPTTTPPSLTLISSYPLNSPTADQLASSEKQKSQRQSELKMDLGYLLSWMAQEKGSSNFQHQEGRGAMLWILQTPNENHQTRIWSRWGQ